MDVLPSKADGKWQVSGHFQNYLERPDKGTPNCFMFPLDKGGWRVFRFSPGIAEAETWNQDKEGWTNCYFNCLPNLRTAAKAMGAQEDPDRGGFQVMKNSSEEKDSMDSTNSVHTGEHELHIQRELVKFLRVREWHVERMLANAFQNGIPDLFCYHRKWGMRWVDVKRPTGYSLTLRQRQKWPEWEKAGIGIWILTAATQEQYDLLFQPPNWRSFWKSSFAVPTLADIDVMLDELDHEEEQPQASDQSE